jgi:hypothetical protein
VNCPWCHTPAPDPLTSKFCEGCGLVLPFWRPRPVAKPADKPEIRCRECGVIAVSRRCRNCGFPVTWPEDMVPPDEEGPPGKPAPPALELPDDGPALELDDPPAAAAAPAPGDGDEG